MKGFSLSSSTSSSRQKTALNHFALPPLQDTLTQTHGQDTSILPMGLPRSRPLVQARHTASYPIRT